MLRSLARHTDVRLPAGTFDVREWHVRTRSDQEEIGRVVDVLIDDADQPRYLDVRVAHLDRNVLLPVGEAELDSARDIVWVHGMGREQFASIPEWDRDAGRVDAAYEARLGDAYSHVREDRLYDRPEYRATWSRARGTAAAAGSAAGATAGVARTVTTGSSRREGLRRLSDLPDYEVAEDDPDPRGWSVRSADGRMVGEVDELIVDPAAMTVRYLDVHLDSSSLDLTDRDRHILVPIGYSRLDTGEDSVVLDALRASELADIPAHEGTIERGFEELVQQRFADRFDGERRYDHPRYRPERLFASRENPDAPPRNDERRG